MKKNTTNNNTNNTNDIDTNIDSVVNEIDNAVKKLSELVLVEVKGLLPQANVDVENVNKNYEKGINAAKAAFIKDSDTEAFIASVEKVKAARDAALNSGNLWACPAKDYEIDKDFLSKAGFTALADKECCNKYNTLITSIFNIIKYTHSIKYKLNECKTAYEQIGQTRLCRVFKHGAYGAKKTFNAVKGKEGLNSKVPLIDTLYELLTK